MLGSSRRNRSMPLLYIGISAMADSECLKEYVSL